MMKKRSLLLLLSSLLYSAETYKSELLDEINYLQEETFVLSASRVKEDVKKSASSITVITSEMIEEMPADNILDVLATVPGLGVTQSNIQAREVESRGIKDRSSKQVLFMIDGHSLDANLINGGSIWSLDRLNLDYIERIEVIKGPASSLYGSSAFVALVNIITKKARDVDGLVVRGRYASYNTKEVNALYGKKYDDFSILADVNVYKTDGASVYVHRDRSKQSGTTNPWGKSIRAYLKMNYKGLYLSSLYSKREDGPYFGAVGNVNDEDHHQNYQYFVELGYKKDVLDNLNIATRVYMDKIRVEIDWELFSEGHPNPKFKDGMKTSNGITNEKDGVEAIATYHYNSDFTAIVGATYEKQKQYDAVTKRNFGGVPPHFVPLPGMIDFTGKKDFAPDVERDMKAAYINTLYDATKDVRLTLGVRYDSYTKLGSNVSPRGGMAWQINQNNTFKVMYGEGFRVPMFAELYNHHILTKGNPDLVSETVKTTEITFLSTLNRRTNLKVTLFNNDFKNLITKVISPSASQYENIGKVNTRGAEFEVEYKLYRGSYVKANYTYQQAVDEDSGDDLPDVAKNKGNIMFNYRLNRYVSVYNHLFVKGKTQRVSSDPRPPLDGYEVFNMAVRIMNLYKGLEFKISANNLFNAKIYDPAIKNFVYDDYETQQRSIAFEIKYKL